MALGCVYRQMVWLLLLRIPCCLAIGNKFRCVIHPKVALVMWVEPVAHFVMKKVYWLINWQRFSGKYFMYIQDEIKFSNLLDITTFHRVCSKNKTTVANSGAGTKYHYWEPEYFFEVGLLIAPFSWYLHCFKTHINMRERGNRRL